MEDELISRAIQLFLFLLNQATNATKQYGISLSVIVGALGFL
jgi:hypothetical protein